MNFCGNPTLQYLWPRYLPNDAIVDPFWAHLQALIINRLKILPIMQTYKTGALKCIEQLRIVPKSCRDEKGKPLFEDLPDEVYLSDEYSEQELSILRTIGLRDIETNQVLDRLKADLKSDALLSRMKGIFTSDGWHTNCARLLLHEARASMSLLEEIKSLEMIPLQDFSWTSIKSGPVYDHHINNVGIPLDLGLRLLHPCAALYPARKELFDYMGVKNCDTSYVKKLIVGKYAKWNNVNLASSVRHLYFLFKHCSEDEESIHRTMFLYDAKNVPVYRVRVALGRPEMIIDDIYLDTPGPYDVRAICTNDSVSDAFNIHIINQAYMECEEASSVLHKLPWKTWLEKHGGVLRSPRLVDAHDPKKLSSFFEWIIKTRSDLLLGILKTHWKAYEGFFDDPMESNGSAVLAMLQEAKLPCSNGESVPLHKTFLPLEENLKLADELGTKDDIRFLKLPLDLPKASLEQWGFLGAFGVGYEDNVNFCLEALRSISSRRNQDQPQQRRNSIKIYEAIEQRTKAAEYPRLR